VAVKKPRDTSGADDDNITNFGKGTSLGDDKP
jgi:hypothetical protein